MSDALHDAEKEHAGRDRRTRDAALLREAVAALEARLGRVGADLRAFDESLCPQLRSCAAAARRMALPPERYLKVVKRILDRRPDLHAEIESLSLVAPRWSRRERLISWAIAEYFAQPSRSEG